MINKTAEEKIDTLIIEVSKIKGYLENDDSTNTKGVVDSVRDINKRVYKIENREKIRNTRISLLATVFGVIGSFLMYVLQAIINKKI